MALGRGKFNVGGVLEFPQLTSIDSFASHVNWSDANTYLNGPVALTLGKVTQISTGTTYLDCSNIRSNTLKILVLPATLTAISGNASYTDPKPIYCLNCNTLVCLATTPPTLSGRNNITVSSSAKIYVPDESLSAYKTSSWRKFAETMFYPLSEWEGIPEELYKKPYEK